MILILVILLVLVAAGVQPHWPYSTGWGPYPSSALTVVVIILLVLLLTGRL